MVRSLWTGATGMIAQQLNVDNISNNLANVNTTGYKSEAMEFKSLLYQTVQTKTTTANGENKPMVRKWDWVLEILLLPLSLHRAACWNPQDLPISQLMVTDSLVFVVMMEIHIIQEMVILCLQ